MPELGRLNRILAKGSPLASVDFKITLILAAALPKQQSQKRDNSHFLCPSYTERFGTNGLVSEVSPLEFPMSSQLSPIKEQNLAVVILSAQCFDPAWNTKYQIDQVPANYVVPRIEFSRIANPYQSKAMFKVLVSVETASFYVYFVWNWHTLRQISSFILSIY